METRSIHWANVFYLSRARQNERRTLYSLWINAFKPHCVFCSPKTKSTSEHLVSLLTSLSCLAFARVATVSALDISCPTPVFVWTISINSTRPINYSIYSSVRYRPPPLRFSEENPWMSVALQHTRSLHTTRLRLDRKLSSCLHDLYRSN